MKVERKEAFEPITITLETQDEVDQIYAIANFAPITRAFSEVGESCLDDLYRKLGFLVKTDNHFNKWHTVLSERLKII